MRVAAEEHHLLLFPWPHPSYNSHHRHQRPHRHRHRYLISFLGYFFQQSFYVFCIVVCIPLLALRVENEALVRESSCAEPNSKFMAVRPNGDFSPEQEK